MNRRTSAAPSHPGQAAESPASANLPPIARLTPPQLVGFLCTWQRVVLLVGTSSPQNFLVPVAEYYGGPSPKAGLGYFNVRNPAEQAWLLPLVEDVLPDEGGRKTACRGYYLFVRGLAVGYHPGLYDPRLDGAVHQADRMVHVSRSQPQLSAALQQYERIAREAAALVIRHFDDLLRAAPLTEPDPYDVLGVPRTADLAEIRAAYHARLHEVHPDRVAAMDEETQRVANRRSQAIIGAFRRIKDSRGGSGDATP